MLDLLLAEGNGTATTLGQALPVSRQAVSKHLTVLTRVGLVRSEPAGRAAPDEDGVVFPVVLLRCGDIPQRLGVLGGARNDVVDQQGPLADGQRFAGRTAIPTHRVAEGVDPRA